MEGFTTGINFTTLPYWSSGKLKGVKRSENGDLTHYFMDGETVIPDTDVIQRPKIEYTQYLLNESNVKDITKMNIANLNVSALSHEIEDYLREYLTLKEDDYAVVVNYILSSWTPDCYNVIPHLLFTCANSVGNAQLVRDLLVDLVPTLDGDNRAKTMVNAAGFGMTMIGSLHHSEKWEQVILTGGLKKGKPITVKNTRSEVFSPRILTKTRYYRYDFAYEISVLRANADDYYSSLTINRKTKDMRLKLGFYRLKHAIEIKKKSTAELHTIDILGQFANVPAKKLEKFKFILLPSLLFNSDYLTPLKKYISLESPTDTRIDKLVLEEIYKIIMENNPDGKGWYITRKEVAQAIKNDLATIGFEFDFDADLDKMVGVIMFALRCVPANKLDAGWSHWCSKYLMKAHLDAIKPSPP